MKHALTIILSILCWLGAITAEVFCGVAIMVLLSEGMDLVMMVYLSALFILGPCMSVVAFRMFYRHYLPSAKQAKWLSAMSILTFVLCLPTCYYLIAFIFDNYAGFTPPFGIFATILSVIIPIASVTICIYVLKHALQRLNETN
ncbi:MAG: hypothetical protein MJZ86_07065 [Bacteroidales bacterium]|nr:hypothetical protein [Bacteroidales bacterium]